MDQTDIDWIALETAIACHGPAQVSTSEGIEVYGGCLEPCYRLQSETYVSRCPSCDRWRLICREWEEAEGGSLNTYRQADCDACGYHRLN